MTHNLFTNFSSKSGKCLPCSLAATLIAICMALLSISCGGDGKSDPAPTPTPTQTPSVTDASPASAPDTEEKQQTERKITIDGLGSVAILYHYPADWIPDESEEDGDRASRAEIKKIEYDTGNGQMKEFSCKTPSAPDASPEKVKIRANRASRIYIEEEAPDLLIKFNRNQYRTVSSTVPNKVQHYNKRASFMEVKVKCPGIFNENEIPCPKVNNEVKCKIVITY
ncbi:MAG: hypothetical protein KIT57_19720 [Blastocatellales bacterium]|nr:hypothetical protein [Blastocatellales bacterium]